MTLRPFVATWGSLSFVTLFFLSFKSASTKMPQGASAKICQMSKHLHLRLTVDTTKILHNAGKWCTLCSLLMNEDLLWFSSLCLIASRKIYNHLRTHSGAQPNRCAKHCRMTSWSLNDSSKLMILMHTRFNLNRYVILRPFEWFCAIILY